MSQQSHLGIYLKETVMEKDTCTRLHCSTIFNIQDTEATKLYI